MALRCRHVHQAEKKFNVQSGQINATGVVSNLQISTCHSLQSRRNRIPPSSCSRLWGHPVSAQPPGHLQVPLSLAGDKLVRLLSGRPALPRHRRSSTAISLTIPGKKGSCLGLV